MKRVAIVGTPGSGKSTFARELSARLDLPVIHLDQHFFLPGWNARPQDEWEEIAERLLAGDRWVMDGAFAMEEAAERADAVVFLDFARWRGYLGSARRLVRAYMGRPAPDFAPGCEDRLDRDFLRLMRMIHHYPRIQRPKLIGELDRLRERGTRVVVARNRRDLRALRDAAIPLGE